MSFKIRISKFFALVLFLINILFAQFGFAQNLPNAQEKPVYISVNNLPEYQKLLLDRFVYWVKEQKIYPRVVNKIEFDNAYSQSWLEKSKENAAHFSLDEKGLLKKIDQYDYSGGFIFGMATEINLEKNPQIKAAKILWNLASLPNTQHGVWYNLNYNWIGTQSLLKKANAQLLRIVNPQVLNEDAPGKFWNETILKFFSPTILSNYSYLSKIALVDEKFWIFSNVLNNLRNIPVEIKGDKLVSCSLNFEDIFVWNGNPNSVEVKFLAEKEILLPFPALAKFSLQNIDLGNNIKPGLEKAKEQKLPSAKLEEPKSSSDKSILSVRGNKQKSDGTYTFNLFNYESQQYAQLSSWSPISLYWVPRKVWIIEIIHKSGLYPYYKEDLVIDQEFFLPYFKISYNQLGEEEKIVFSSWSVAESKDQHTSLPFLTFVTAVEQGNSVVCMQNTESVLISDNIDHPKFKDLKSSLNIDSYTKDEKKEEIPIPEKPKENEKQEKEFLD